MKTKTLSEKLAPYTVKNKTKKYRCSYCNSLFKIQDLNFDYTEAIYCINCGKDTLTEET